MALEEKMVVDQIEVTRTGNIQVRRANLVLRDGVEIAKTYHREVLAPGTSLEGQEDRIKAVANAVWTEEVIAKHKEKKDKSFADETP